MALKKRHLRVLSDQETPDQEPEINIIVRMPWQAVLWLLGIIVFVTLVVQLSPHVIAKLNFDGSIEWNIPDSTETQK